MPKSKSKRKLPASQGDVNRARKKVRAASSEYMVKNAIHQANTGKYAYAGVSGKPTNTNKVGSARDMRRKAAARGR